MNLNVKDVITLEDTKPLLNELLQKYNEKSEQ